jgi:hypothetical protein
MAQSVMTGFDSGFGAGLRVLGFAGSDFFVTRRISGFGAFRGS